MSQNRPAEPDIDELSDTTVQHKTGSGYSITGHTTDDGFAVHYETPDRHEPYGDWDWIAVYRGNEVPDDADLGNYINWNWTCPNEQCGHTGIATIPNAAHESGEAYTLVYFTWKWNVVATDTIIAPA